MIVNRKVTSFIILLKISYRKPIDYSFDNIFWHFQTDARKNPLKMTEVETM